MSDIKPINILSIDGGGIRGIIPAMVLAEIEARTNYSISSMFDLVAGSSTGGLLAMALTVPDEDGKPRYTAAELPDLYEKYSKMIFSRTRWDAILSMDNWRFRRYPETGMNEALRKVFGDADLTDALTDILITSYDIERRRPWFFRSSRAREGERCNFLMREVVRATTAAPTFFEPAQIPNSDDADVPFSLIDGSMTSINPSLCAYVEAREMYPDARDFIVVSLGTGNLTQPLSHKEVRDWGLLNWARPLSDIMFDASSRTVDYQMERLLPTMTDADERYFRFQKRIEGVDHSMDDVSEVSLALVREWGAELIVDNNDRINQMCDLLVEAKEIEAKQAEAEKTISSFFNFQSLAFWRNRSEGEVAQTG